MHYFDIHSHLNFPQYDADPTSPGLRGASREDVITRMKESGTATIVVGTDFESSERAVKLAEQHEDIYACIGVHPADDTSASFEVEKFKSLVSNSKVVAIGECGLDFFHVDKVQDYQRQADLFYEQINFALGFNLPIMIHARDAYEELLEILEPLKIEHGEKLRGDVHFFAGNLEIAKRFWTIGFTTSFTGVITFARDYDEVIKNAPLEMIMSETDAPFVAPAPHRGKRNEPSFVSEVVKKIAEIRGEDLDTVKKALYSNAKRVFNISA